MCGKAEGGAESLIQEYLILPSLHTLSSICIPPLENVTLGLHVKGYQSKLFSLYCLPIAYMQLPQLRVAMLEILSPMKTFIPYVWGEGYLMMHGKLFKMSLKSFIFHMGG